MDWEVSADFGLPQIFSFIDPQNVRSIRVAEKIGEGLAFHTFYKDILLAIYTAHNPRYLAPGEALRTP